eukprot:TRINITY_DN355_c1_g2_i1.p1 TRINITY_DN355_c1_g2~~TRINITY_DN355_c1_g2_i1.p1  ORF type:complete len:542 (+),score=46.83 TRINITY_DN355_c1_g2_i1:181-1806(+)
MTLVNLGLFGLVIFIFLYGFRIVTRIKLRKIPGPPPSWLLGNLLQVKQLTLDRHRWFLEYGPIYKFFMGGRPFIVVSDPELCRKVFMKSHYREIESIGPPVAGVRRQFQLENLFWAKGQQFKTLKSAWQVAFNQGSVSNYFSLMQQHAQQLCELLNVKAKSGEYFDIFQEIQRMTLEVVGTTAFGIDFGLLEREQSVKEINTVKLMESIKIMFGGRGGAKSKAAGGPSPWLIINAAFPELRKFWGFGHLYLPITTREKMLKAAELQLIQDSEKIVALERAKNQQHEHNEKVNTNDSNENGFINDSKQKRNIIDPGSFLAKLINTKDSMMKGQYLSGRQVAAQVFLFILTGFETTANTLAFTVYLLSLNPEKKEKMVEEVRQLKEITPENLEQCKYLEAVIKESLRLLPPGAGSLRSMDQPFQLGEYTIPAKTDFFLNSYSTQRDPMLWEQPEEFIPERFIESSPHYVMDKLHPFAYLPFGGGSRMCVGHRYAMQEAKLALCQMYQKYDFELEEGQVPLETRMTITMSPKKGVIVKAFQKEY